MSADSLVQTRLSSTECGHRRCHTLTATIPSHAFCSGRWLSEQQEKAPRSTLATFTEVQHLPAVLEADRRDSYVMAMSHMPNNLLSKVTELRQSLQVMSGLGQELR